MKNTLEGINSRVDEAEDWVNNLENKVAENTQLKQQKKKKIPPNEDSLMGLWDNLNCTNIPITWCQKDKREQKIGNLFEKIMKENFTNLVK